MKRKLFAFAFCLTLIGFFYPDRRTGYGFIYPQTQVTATADTPHS
jgi:hypothetical protein